MNLENTTLWGIVVAICFGLSPILKEFTKHFLNNKIKHSQELDSIRVLEEKSKLDERDKTSEFFKEYIIKKDKDFEVLKEILQEVRVAVQENQFTDKKDFQSLVNAKIELLFLRLENSLVNIINRNHISRNNVETSYKKIENIVERDVNNFNLEIGEIHYHNSLKRQISDVMLFKKDDIVTLLKEVITDYVEANCEKTEKQENAIKQLREAINYLNNSFTTAIQKIII